MRRLLVTIACAAALALLAGCAGSGAVPASSASSPTSASSGLPEPIPTPWLGTGPGDLSTEVVNALLEIRETGPTLYPEHFAGVSTGTPASADVLVIFLADSTEEIEANFRSIAKLPEDELRFETAYQSLEAAERVDRLLTAGVDALRARGIELQTYGVGVDGVEEIGMDHPTDEQVEYLFATYGPYLRVDRNVAPARLL